MPRPLRALLAVSAVVLVFPGPAPAQLVKAGIVTTLQGSATVTRTAAPQGNVLRPRDDVFRDDRITTADRSLARLLLGGKAVVTIRERSTLTITEVPGVSTVAVTAGGVALSVARERLTPGEAVNIRTPNAIASVRGTVLIVEVARATAQAGAATQAAALTTTFTLLSGTLTVNTLDPTGNPIGPGVPLGPLQTTSVTGSQPPRPPVTLTPQAAQRVASSYKAPLKDTPSLTSTQIQGVAADINALQAQGPGREPPVVGDPLFATEVTSEAIRERLIGQKLGEKKSPAPRGVQGS